MVRLATCGLLFMFWSTLVLSETAQAQLQTELSPDKDNTLYEDVTGSSSNGAGVNLFTGRNQNGEVRRALLRFDIASSLPANSLVDSVTLALTASQAPVNPVTIEVHRVLAAWGEGSSDAPGNEANGTTAQAGDATWLHRIYDTTFWSLPGGDFEIIASADQTVDAVGSHTWLSTAQMVADVQDWNDNPASNYGWLLTAAGVDSQTVVWFDSRESAEPSSRPLLTVFCTPPVSVDEENSQLPGTPGLSQNYPNPFNPTTIIEYSVPRSSHVQIEVFNVLGHRVITLVDGWVQAGHHTIEWDGADVASGVYLYRFRTGDYIETRKLMLLK
ncbi:MAG: T9SS type A sorting domain-containing protein [Candidatus Zixiibacteriota bacterium]|nr:MAG: T9SS type A sorting domain-containing protein [candidate division Zixibacteria bacterium]